MRYGLTSLVVIAAITSCGEQHVRESVGNARAWMLEAGGATLYDLKGAKPLIRVSLPGWHWAGGPFSCGPAIASGPGGEAVVTSDVATTLWRIDPASFVATVHDPALDADADKDAGFIGLVYSRALSAYFAVTGHGTLWRIDPLLRRAQKIALSEPLRQPCGIRLRDERRRLMSFCVSTADDEVTVELAPDQRSGFVRISPLCVARPGRAMSGSGNGVDRW